MAKVRIWDVETSGHAEDGGVVIESGWVDVDLETKEIGPVLNRLYGLPEGVDLSPEVRAVHHIQKKDLPTETFVADDWANEIKADGIVAMVAHNSSYESSFMTPPVPIFCSYKSALRVWPDASTHSNSGLRYWLQDQGLIEPVDELCLPHHRAGPDAYVTAWIFIALLNAGATGKDMKGWTAESALLPRCPIGEWRGKPWTEIDAGFLKWAIGKPSMSEEIKWNCKRELDRRAA